MLFIVIIESSSLIIWSFTLSIRLIANIIAGHILLSLLDSSGQSIYNLIISHIIILSQILLFIFYIYYTVESVYYDSAYIDQPLNMK